MTAVGELVELVCCSAVGVVLAVLVVKATRMVGAGLARSWARWRSWAGTRTGSR